MLLHRYAGLRYAQSTSMFAAHAVYTRYLHNDYTDFAACYADRRNRRVLWGNLIAELNGPSKCGIYVEMAKTHDIFNGIRRQAELEASRRAGVFDLAVWIARPGVPRDDSLDYGPAVCDIIIPNAGDLAEFDRRLIRLACLFSQPFTPCA